MRTTKQIYRTLLLLAGISLFGCNQSKSNKNKIKDIKVVNQVDSLSFDYFDKMFKTVEIPYSFCSDTIDNDSNFKYFNIEAGGNLKRKQVIKFLLDTTFLNKNVNCREISNSLDYTFNVSVWGGFKPLLKIITKEKTLYFVLHSMAISATNGGFTDIYAFNYKNNKLVDVKKLGIYGYELHKNYTEFEYYDYFKQTIMEHQIVIDIKENLICHVKENIFKYNYFRKSYFKKDKVIEKENRKLTKQKQWQLSL